MNEEENVQIIPLTRDYTPEEKERIEEMNEDLRQAVKEFFAL